VFVVDTNVLVYAADADSPAHVRCRESLERWRAQATPWYLTWGIVYEFLRVATHPRVFRMPWSAPAAWSFVDAVMASPAVHVLSASRRHPEVLAEIIEEIPHLTDNLFHDAHTAALMREHGVKTVVTRDTDFHRFPFLQVADPLT
jgi:uncharacterized protein